MSPGYLVTVLPLPPGLSCLCPAHSTQAEVCNLESTVGADQEVGGLEVAVHDVVTVEVRHALEQHQHVALDIGDCQGVLRILDHLGQVRHHELKHQDEPEALREHVVQPSDHGNDFSMILITFSHLTM